jgi:hypothetical protein
VSYSDDLTAAADIARDEREMESICAAPDTDGVCHTRVGREFLLESAYLFAQDVLAAVNHPTHGVIDLALVRKILGTRVGAQNHPETCTLGT